VGAEAAPSKRGLVVDQTGGNVTLDLFVLTQRLGLLLDAAIADTGLTASTYAVYTQLERGPLTPGQLSETLGLRPTTLSGYLAAMERAGHLTRTRHQADGRSRLLALTQTGKQKVDECRPKMRQAIQQINKRLGSADEVRQARLTLGRIDRAIAGARSTLPGPSPRTAVRREAGRRDGRVLRPAST
jgi:DNA-binding MarR family transcriptional regulator